MTNECDFFCVADTGIILNFLNLFHGNQSTIKYNHLNVFSNNIDMQILLIEVNQTIT